MSVMQYGEVGDTLYFWFGSNTQAGTGNDGASAVCHVREAGAASSAAPVISPTPAVLTHASHLAGSYEVAINATGGNGFSDATVYAVFCSLTVDSQNPTGFVGGFSLGQLVTPTELDTAILTQATAANVTHKLDHLVSAAESDDPVDNSIIAKLASATGDWSTFAASTDSLEAINAIVNNILTDTGTTLNNKIDTIDSIVDAIKAKTDDLTFTVTNQVDSNTQSFNDVSVTGDGVSSKFAV